MNECDRTAFVLILHFNTVYNLVLDTGFLSEAGLKELLGQSTNEKVILTNPKTIDL